LPPFSCSQICPRNACPKKLETFVTCGPVFIFNEKSDDTWDAFRVPATQVEKLAGIKLWQGLDGKEIDREKSKIRKLW